MLRPAHVIQACAAALLALGVVMVHSAGASVHGADAAAADAGPIAAATGVLNPRTLVYAGLALGVMVVASRINVREMFSIRPIHLGPDATLSDRLAHLLRGRGWFNPLWVIVLLSLALTALTLVPGMGKNVNGASRWLYIGGPSMGISFQPSELVKWVMVLAVAWWCARRRFVMHKFVHGLLPPILLMILACGMIVIEDLGTAALIGLVGVCMLIAGGARWWQLGLFAVAGLGGLIALIINTPYRLQRLTTFLDPWADPAGAGYHPIQSMLAFAQGGLQGSGLGQSIQKYYIPEDTTDFIFPILAEELGLPGAAIVVLLILAILWVGLGIVKDCKDTFGRLVGLGVLLTFGIQAAVNLAVVTVVVPTKGIALPLVSNGGTGWILCGFSLGLVAALDNANYYQVAPAGDELVEAELDEEPTRPDDGATDDETPEDDAPENDTPPGIVDLSLA
ncbi:MAG: FtsW/RodA/SpoVE family cell cycle protein [Planctomycetes bacterium]|nr:FtsW/RodA/SpoVE family cell cycle protein [Planctomycetota bacterium]